MRIIGGHDYYDGGLTYGFDPSIVFIRDSNTTKTENFLPYSNKLSRFFVYNLESKPKVDYDFTITPIIVYVAGTKYTGIKVLVSSKKPSSLLETYCFWNYSSLEVFLNTYGKTTKYLSRFKKNIDSEPERLIAHFKENASKKEFQKCVNEKVVVATLELPYNHKEKAIWKVNGDNLKNYEFYKVMDVYTCYQEISMFIGGILPGNENKTVEVSNPKKIEKHGFNKWSFRKPPNSK